MKRSRLAVVVGWILLPATPWAHPGHEGDPDTSSGQAANLPAPQVSLTTEGEYRVIKANGLPNHAIGSFPGPGCPNPISAQNYAFRVPLHPKTNATFTPLRMQAIGVALNGVPFDPGTAEYWKNDRTSGWHVEAIGSKANLGLDRNNAHVQPSGAYHYHGIPTGLLTNLASAETPKLIGYAADGFPIYAQTPGDASGYRLKSGSRPGGSAGPGGKYDGTYEQDYEFVGGADKLDEANGKVGKTAEYPEGTYYYVATAEYPFYPRKLKGTPDPSFHRGPPGGGPAGGPTQGGESGGRDGKPGKPGKPGPIQRFDKNGDGKISLEEAPPPMQQNFSRHDANRDGFLDSEEVKSLPARGGPPGNAGEGFPGPGNPVPEDLPTDGASVRKPWMENHISELDSDRNGSVSREEMTSEAEKVFRGYDVDGDGKITEKEAEAGEGKVRSAMAGFLRQHFPELDVDGNGSVSLGELKEAAVKMWDKHFQNHGSQPPPP